MSGNSMTPAQKPNSPAEIARLAFAGGAVGGSGELTNANRVVLSDGDGTVSESTLEVSDLLVDGDIGTAVQAYDAGLTSIAGVTTVADRMLYTTAADTYAVADLTAAGRALIDDADASAQRITLGVENFLTLNFAGFVSWGGSGSYYTIAASDFTVDRAGTGMIDGTTVTWLGGQTVTLGGNNTNTYIYVDSSGTLQSSTSSSAAIFTDNIPLFEVFTDNGGNRLTVRENHPADFQSAVSIWAHKAAGTVFDLSGGAVVEAAATTGHVEIVGDGTLLDHGIETSVADSAGVGVSWNIYYTNASLNWVRYAQQQAIPDFYNASGTPTAITVNKYAVYRLYASKDDLEGSATYVAVMGDTQYNNLADAQAAIEAGEIPIATAPLTGIEIAQLGFAIVDDDGAVTVSSEKATLTSSVAGVAGLGSLAFQDASDVAITGGTATLDQLLYTAATELTIATGAVTVTQSAHRLQPEIGTADDLATISGTVDGESGWLYVTDEGTDTVTIKHGTGNLSCVGASDIELSQGAVQWYSDGTTVYVSGGGGASVAGSDTQVQFNDGGELGASAALTYDKTTESITVGGALSILGSEQGSNAQGEWTRTAAFGTSYKPYAGTTADLQLTNSTGGSYHRITSSGHEFSGQFHLATVFGVDIGSDDTNADRDLVTVRRFGGAKTLSWDESEARFVLDDGLILGTDPDPASSAVLRVGGAGLFANGVACTTLTASGAGTFGSIVQSAELIADQSAGSACIFRWRSGGARRFEMHRSVTNEDWDWYALGGAAGSETAGLIAKYSRSGGNWMFAGPSAPASVAANQIAMGAGVARFANGVHAATYSVSGNQVVGARGAAVANATDAASVIARLNDLLARLRTHGLIAA